MTQTTERPTPRRKKITVSATISPGLNSWINDQVDNKMFSSPSDAISTALCEMKWRMESTEGKGLAIEEVKNSALEAIDEIKKTTLANENSTMLLLNLLLNHQELIEEINNLMLSRRNDCNQNKKHVVFK